MRAAVRIAATVVTTVAVLGALPAPARAAEPCVGVIVDGRLLGGDVRTGCAEGDPDSGLEALDLAGFGYAFVPRQPGLVCQLDGVPGCEQTSATTYWSYWYREKDSRAWVYSNSGAGNRDPVPGSVEAWVWQDGGRREPPDVGLPLICPQVVAPPASPKPSPSPVRTSERPDGTASPSGDATSTKPAGPKSRTSRSTTPSPTTSSPPSTEPATDSTTAEPTSASASALPTSPTTDPTTAARTEAPAEDDGPPWIGLALGIGLVGALGAAALVRSRRPGGSP